MGSALALLTGSIRVEQAVLARSQSDGQFKLFQGPDDFADGCHIFRRRSAVSWLFGWVNAGGGDIRMVSRASTVASAASNCSVPGEVSDRTCMSMWAASISASLLSPTSQKLLDEPDGATAVVFQRLIFEFPPGTIEKSWCRKVLFKGYGPHDRSSRTASGGHLAGQPPDDSGLGGMFFYSNHFLYLSN